MAAEEWAARLAAVDRAVHPSPNATAEALPTRDELRKMGEALLGPVLSFIGRPRRDSDRAIDDGIAAGEVNAWLPEPEPGRVDRSMPGWRVIGRAPGVRDGR